MNKIARIPMLAAACLATAAALSAATTYERSYVESYSTREGLPKPIAVVSPEVRGDYSSSVVYVRFTVDAYGTPRNIRLPSGLDRGLALALESAVREWRFAPATDNGKPVAKTVVLPFQITSS